MRENLFISLVEVGSCVSRYGVLLIGLTLLHRLLCIWIVLGNWRTPLILSTERHTGHRQAFFSWKNVHTVTYNGFCILTGSRLTTLPTLVLKFRVPSLTLGVVVVILALLSLKVQAGDDNKRGKVIYFAKSTTSCSTSSTLGRSGST